jgi:AcrR family transcriptional regulator
MSCDDLDMVAAQSSVGRPRLTPRQREGTSAREEILDAAAELFSEHGYAATSTRAIAMAVGIKQASLYYHFANKEQILAELLVNTVVPSLDAATALNRRPDPPEAKLWALAAYDVRLLCSGRWNIGALYLLPELRTERFAPFHQQRHELRSAYAGLVAAGRTSGAFDCPDTTVATDLVFGLVESVVPVRQDRGRMDPTSVAPTVADGCLRLLSVPTRKATAARRRGEKLLELL